MNSLYYVNEQHKKNFKKVLVRWELQLDKSQNIDELIEREYLSTIYILATPIIFEKVEAFLFSFQTPIDWILFWEYQYAIENERTWNGHIFKIRKLPYELSTMAIQLGKFSLNMWNPNKCFNLYDCLKELDAQHYEIFKNAIHLRFGYEFKEKSLSILH